MTSCPRCRSEQRPGARFCSVCGVMLSAARRYRSPLDYTPQRLAARVRSMRPALIGERKQVTVLFADIKGSLELLADRDPEEARALLDPALDAMIEAVHAFDGIVNQVMGDGIMALFGAPLALEDHAARAGFAALRMLKQFSGTPSAPVQLRVGLNSGEVLVRAIGSDLGMDYSAVGRTTHVAARLEQMAQPGTALCSAATLRLAHGALEARSLGAVPVRGLAEPIEIAELVGADPTRSRFQHATAHGLTPFVGRRSELVAIEQGLVRTADGQGQVIALFGEPGIGKSRLVWEIAHGGALRDWLVVQGGAASHGIGVPYLPIRGLLQAHFGIGPRDEPRAAAARVRERLATLGAQITPCVAPVLALLELPNDDERWPTLDPAERRQATSDAICTWLAAEARQRPVLMVVEDLHWTDQETIAVLDALVEQLGSRRIALLIDARPEFRHSWSSLPSMLQVHLKPLDAADAAALLHSLLGSDAALDALAGEIIQRTGGNPFFAEECVRALAEAGTIVGELGHYAPAAGVSRSPLPLPSSVQAVIAARIDRLAPQDKQLLQAAAAVGAVIPVALLQAMPSLNRCDIRRGLARLRSAGFVHEHPRPSEAEYRFVHALTSEAAYAGLVNEQRRALHREIAAAIEASYADRLSEQVERLADHAWRGEAWPAALHWSRKAAQKAAERSAYREALVHMERALDAVARLPPSDDTLAQAIDLRIEMRSTLFPLGEIARDLASLELAQDLAERLCDGRRLARLLTLKTRDLSILGHARQALDCGRLALAAAEQVGEVELTVLANAYLGSVCLARGEYREAVNILSRGLQSFHGSQALARFGLPAPAAVIFRVWLVTALARLGDHAAAAQEAAHSVAIAEQADQPLARLVAQYTRGFALAHRGDWADAMPALETSLELCRRWRLPAWFSNIASVLGWAYAHTGRFADGVALMQQAIDASVRGGAMVNHSSEVARLADALLLHRDLEPARAQAERALALAREYEERGNEAIALQLVARIRHAIAPEDPAAEALHRRAAAMAAELGLCFPAAEGG